MSPVLINYGNSVDRNTRRGYNVFMKPKKQASVKQLVFGAILLGFFAGFHTALGIEYLICQRTEYRWLASFAIAFGFCVVAAKYGLMLLNNVKHLQNEESHS